MKISHPVPFMIVLTFCITAGGVSIMFNIGIP